MLALISLIVTILVLPLATDSIYGQIKKQYDYWIYSENLSSAKFISSNIYSTMLIHVDEEGIFWADCYMEKPDMSYDGSIIRSLSLKWKKLDGDGGNGKFVVPYTNE